MITLTVIYNNTEKF